MMIYRVLDNQTGETLAITFQERIAKNILKTLPDPFAMVDDDIETVRYVYEECTTQSQLESVFSRLFRISVLW